MNKEQAQAQLSYIVEKMHELESQAVALALEHSLNLTLGEVRQGQRCLILEDDNTGWTTKKRGDWMTSTESCN